MMQQTSIAKSLQRVVVIGAGSIGKRHAKGFVATGRARVSICDIDPAKRNDVAAAVDVDHTYANFEDIPLDEFDLAVISAPAHVHIPIAQKLANAGLHFLTEKPLSISLEGVEKLLATVRAKGLVVRVGFIRRALLALQRFKSQIDDGRIGDVKMAYINVSANFPKGRPDYQSTYYAKRAMGGGAILDGVSHLLDIVLWILGPVRQIGAMYDRLVLQGVECEDSVIMNLRMASGALVNITMNQFQKPRAESFEMIGTMGNLRYLGAGSRIEFCGDESGLWENAFDEGSMDVGGRTSEEMLCAQANAFLDAIEGKPDPLCSLEEARDNLRVCLAAKESDAAQRIVDVG